MFSLPMTQSDLAATLVCWFDIPRPRTQTSLRGEASGARVDLVERCARIPFAKTQSALPEPGDLACIGDDARSSHEQRLRCGSVGALGPGVRAGRAHASETGSPSRAIACAPPTLPLTAFILNTRCSQPHECHSAGSSPSSRSRNPGASMRALFSRLQIASDNFQ